MKEAERIVNQLQRAFAGEPWHGPAVMTILEGITAAQAASHPVKNAHSIWEIVLHISAWDGACVRRLQEEPAQLSDAEDWPVVNNTSEEAWEQTKLGLRQNNGKLSEAISHLEDTVLDQPVSDAMSSFYVTAHGIIQHDLYHAGQIAILKKALSEA